MTILIIIIALLALLETLESWYYKSQLDKWKQAYKKLEKAHRELKNPNVNDKNKVQMAKGE